MGILVGVRLHPSLHEYPGCMARHMAAAYTIVRLAELCSMAAAYTVVRLAKSCSRWAMTAAYTIL
jgi:hypothetical protein